jgi:hypothetical protein
MVSFFQKELRAVRNIKVDNFCFCMYLDYIGLHMLNNHLFQKFMSIENDEFNYLIYILTHLASSCMRSNSLSYK